jgi:hypothetical protein
MAGAAEMTSPARPIQTMAPEDSGRPRPWGALSILTLLLCGLPGLGKTDELACANANACLQQALELRDSDGESAALERLDLLVERYPRRLRIKAERALSLYRLYQMTECIDQVDALLESELPPNVRANLLALREEAKVQLGSRQAARYALRMAFGYDDNVASFTDYDPRLGSGGTPVLVRIGGRPDEYAEAGGRLRWRPLGFGRLQPRADVDLSLRRYENASEFDLDDLRLRFGGEWRPVTRIAFGLAPGWRHIRRSGHALLDDHALEFSASANRDPYSLRIGLERAQRRYARSTNRGLDATHHAVTLRGQALLGTSPQTWFGVDLEYRDEDARDSAQSRKLRRAGASVGRSRGLHEMSLAVEGNWFRYHAAAQTPQWFDAAELPGFDVDGAGLAEGLVIGASRLRYRGAEFRYRYNLNANWSLQLRLRRLLADLGDRGNGFDRTSLDFGVEWNR